MESRIAELKRELRCYRVGSVEYNYTKEAIMKLKLELKYAKISEYLSTIGRKGGKRSRRCLTSEQASDMAKKRWSAEKKKNKEEQSNNS